MRVALLLPYFGNLPDWITLYFVTCSRQPGYDWLVFTDADCSEWGERFENIHFHRMTMQDLEMRVRQILGETPGGKMHPKKICDYRPMFAEIFADYLIGYDYWGHVDHDLFVGNLSPLLPYMASRCDVISTHRSRIAGPLTLYRMGSAIGKLHHEIPGYQRMLHDTSSQWYCEEAAFSETVRKASADARITVQFLDAFTIADDTSENVVYRDGQILIRQHPWEWMGNLFRAGLHSVCGNLVSYFAIPEQYAYYHFRLLKDRGWRWEFDPYNVNGWSIHDDQLLAINH